MSLIAGRSLKAEKFFKQGSPEAKASSFDLSIGYIYDSEGNALESYTLEPGHMVQVVSAEVFNLPNNVTGHVTYKTGLTQVGIWALTVGIVDPGWDGPIATTLFNFSKHAYRVKIGTPFLRVTFFEHSPATKKQLRTAKNLDQYLGDIESLAATKFPSTFLDSIKIAKDAGRNVLNRIRIESLAWVVLIAAIFTIIQVLSPLGGKMVEEAISPTELSELQKEIKNLNEQLSALKLETNSILQNQKE